MNESELITRLRLKASQEGYKLWRNNVGAAVTNTGSYIRFGLGNDSANLNKVLKSADLIGIKPVVITQEMVGQTIGQFISLEVKKPGWVYKATQHELAQSNWKDLINSLGGDARFVTEVENDIRTNAKKR